MARRGGAARSRSSGVAGSVDHDACMPVVTVPIMMLDESTIYQIRGNMRVCLEMVTVVVMVLRMTLGLGHLSESNRALIFDSRG